MNNEANVDCVFASSIISVKQDSKRKNATVKNAGHISVYHECYY